METYLETKDYSVSGESFKLLHDKDRDMLITHPKPEDLTRYYLSNSYISHTDSHRSLADKAYQLVKRITLRKKVRWMESFAYTERSVLDLGAGTGDFLRVARRKGWQYDGVEPNPMARGLASEKNLSLYSNLNDLPSGKYQIITLWHVLEHLPDLNQQIEKILTFLKEGGSLFVAVPNYKSYDAQYYKDNWAAFDVPRHLWHFSQLAIERIFSNYDMHIVEKKPMIFDAFYVAMLSEKYRGKKFPLLRGFITGLRSNMKAMRTEEYSSLLYILQRRPKAN